MSANTGSRRGADYRLAAAKWWGGGDFKEKPLERFVQVDRWRRSETGSVRRDGPSELQLDYAADTLTLLGDIPGLTPDAVFVVSTFANTGAELVTDESVCR